MLKSQVSTMLVVLQVVNQVQETLLPILLRRPSTRRMMNKFSKKMEDRSKKSATPPQPVKVTSLNHCICFEMDCPCFKGVAGFQSECSFQCDHGCVDRLPVLNPADLKVVMANYSLKRDPYESTYDDFMEVWLQFGHVFLFSSVYPLAGLFALMNNIFEIKVHTKQSTVTCN